MTTCTSTCTLILSIIELKLFVKALSTMSAFWKVGNLLETELGILVKDFFVIPTYLATLTFVDRLTREHGMNLDCVYCRASRGF